MENAKQCVKCLEVKPLADFHRRTDSPDGYRNSCRECHKQRCREYAQDNSAAISAHKRAAYQENRDRIIEQRRKFRAEHNERINAHRRALRAAQPKPTRADKFWARVDTSSDCWIWTGAKTRDGYGFVSVDNRTVQAHRFAYLIARGPIADGLFVCHHCDNPPCVNPDHLWLGTHQDNVDDRQRKGRHRIKR